MTIIAKFPGTCRKCGQAIKAGQEINWTKGEGSEHVACAVSVSTKDTTTALVSTEAAPISKTFSRRSKHAGPTPGFTFKAQDGQILTVVRVSSRYVSRDECEDNDDFRFGGDAYYQFTAACRVATAEEATPVLAAIAAEEAEKAAKLRIDAIKRQIQDQGERPEGPVTLSGETLMDTSNIYGGGDWFVITEDAIWHVRNNGSDGADWSHNNIRTGGAGAIGWMIPLDESLAAELRDLAKCMTRGQ